MFIYPRRSRVVIIAGIIVIIGALIWGAFTGLTNLQDLIHGVSVHTADNRYGGKTITKVGDRPTYVKGFPEAELPVSARTLVTGYTLDTDQAGKIVSAVESATSEEQIDAIVDFYKRAYGTWEGFTKTDSADKKDAVMPGRTVGMTCKKGGYTYLVSIKTLTAQDTKADISLSMTRVLK